MQRSTLLALLGLAAVVSARDSSIVTKTDDESTETDQSTKSAKKTTTEKSIIVVTIAVEPLTTTFTPPASCTGHLSQLASPGYALWLNEPQPAVGIKVSDCYPSQFMERYTSLVNESSSIAPLMSPLVCPKGWKTAKEWENGYIACCASGYNLAPPSVTSDTDRPAYGGTCYSNFEVGQTVTVTAYDSENVTATVDWVASSTADQAYGHVIDGFALDLLVATSVSFPWFPPIVGQPSLLRLTRTLRQQLYVEILLPEQITFPHALSTTANDLIDL